MIDWKSRIKNISFWVSVAIAIFTPLLAYMGLTAEDITTWSSLGNLLFSAIKNPYVLLLIATSVYNAVINPTTKGIGDGK